MFVPNTVSPQTHHSHPTLPAQSPHHSSALQNALRLPNHRNPNIPIQQTTHRRPQHQQIRLRLHHRLPHVPYLGLGLGPLLPLNLHFCLARLAQLHAPLPIVVHVRALEQVVDQVRRHLQRAKVPEAAIVGDGAEEVLQGEGAEGGAEGGGGERVGEGEEEESGEEGGGWFHGIVDWEGFWSNGRRGMWWCLFCDGERVYGE